MPVFKLVINYIILWITNLKIKSLTDISLTQLLRKHSAISFFLLPLKEEKVTDRFPRRVLEMYYEVKLMVALLIKKLTADC